VTTNLLDNLAASKGSHFTNAVRSEWTKIRTIRSTWICLGLAVFVGIGLSILVPSLVAHNWATRGISDKANYDPTSLPLVGVGLAQLVMGVFGALVITSEYSSGSIRTTFAAVPRRGILLSAKATVLGILTFFVAELFTFAAFLIGSSVLLASGGRTINPTDTLAQQLTSSHIPVATLSTSGVAFAVFRSGLYLALITLFVLGLGFIIRNTAGTIATFVAIILIIPAILGVLPHSISRPIVEHMPSALGSSMASTHQRTTDYAGTLINPWGATALLAIYVIIILLIAWALVKRRDA
jgi:hypothetical protein